LVELQNYAVIMLRCFPPVVEREFAVPYLTRDGWTWLADGQERCTLSLDVSEMAEPSTNNCPRQKTVSTLLQVL